MKLQGKTILLVISGGIAAYKSLELIRLLKGAGARVPAILTQGGAHFITALSVSALTGEKTYTDLWSLTDEVEMGHIRLARSADLIVVAPASANMIAKMAYGLADDLASTTLLATDAPVLIAPAMNPVMWANAATKENIDSLRARGVRIAGPTCGDMACGETGEGRMAEPAALFDAIAALCGPKPLAGKKAVVTSGPTFEAIDPVRFIGNRSSGKTGHAIAAALQAAGANVTLVSGPVALPPPAGVHILAVETAQQMLAAVTNALPADIAVCAAAVADWRAKDISAGKIKKGAAAPAWPEMAENPDILAFLGQTARPRPSLVVGFAAETSNMIQEARQKLTRKGCDWIVANDVRSEKSPFGSDVNTLHLLTGPDREPVVIGPMTKTALADELVARITAAFN